MIEFPVDMIWIVKTMTLRSLWNPNAFAYTTNSLMYAYLLIFFHILLLAIIFFLIKYTYNIIKKIRDNKKIWGNLVTKNDIKETLKKEKTVFKILKYPTIWGMLISTCWMYTSILFRYFGKFYEHNDIIRENLSTQENWVLWVRWTYSILFFVIAWYFIWLSFGNKMLRNIWILIYALWILFVIFAHFLNNWVIINGLPNFTV